MNRPVFRRLAIAALLTSGFFAPALAGEFEAAGDGSQTNNPDLLRVGDGNCPDCDYSDAPSEWTDPLFDIDWSLGLRGAYVQSTTASWFEGIITPEVSLTHEGLRSSFSVTADAEISKTMIDPVRLAAFRIAAAADYALDRVTTISSTSTLSLTQEPPTRPAGPGGVVAESRILAGDTELGVTRDFGFVDVTLRGTAGRTLYGPTEMTGGVLIDNSWQNNTRVGGGARVGHKISPVLTLFADAAAGYQYFDAVSPTLLVKLDGPTYTAKTGVSAVWNSTVEAEASVGLALRRFDAGLPDVTATLYDARVVLRPDETLTLTGVFATALSPPGSGGGTAQIEYTADADVLYEVNPWLALRASAGWYRTDDAGIGTVETGYELGVGADYAVSDQVALTADYTFSHDEAPPSPVVDTHKVMLGVTFSK